MSENPQPSKSTEPTPEQLLKLLDVQISAVRARRRGTSRSRSMIALAAVLLIVIGAMIALLFLQQRIADLPQRKLPAVPPPGEQEPPRARNQGR